MLHRVMQNKGREYDEYGFCTTGPDDSSLQSKATYLQKQSQVLAHQAQVTFEVVVLGVSR